MHTPTLLTMSILLFTLAAAIPSPILFIDRANAAAASPAPKTSASAAPKAGSNSTCSAATMALAAGIQANIDDQGNELATVSALGNVLAQSPMDMTLYAGTQTSLLGYVTKGITIRENNQKIAPSGNAAIAGLAVVGMAQMTELNLTMSLAVPASGMVDQKLATTTVEMLKGDFSGGITKNKENLAMSMIDCTPPAKAADAAPAAAEAEAMPMSMDMGMTMEKK